MDLIRFKFGNYYRNIVNIAASGDCLNFTSLSGTSGSVLTDNSTTNCLTIPNVGGVTPLLEIELMPDCKDNVINNQVRFCCDLTFLANWELILNLEYLYTI